METFGERLNFLRKKKGLSQEGLAASINKKRQVLAHWETGRNEPSMGDLAAISDVLECSIDFLIKGTEMQQNVSHPDSRLHEENVLLRSTVKNLSALLGKGELHPENSTFAQFFSSLLGASSGAGVRLSV